MSDAYNAAPDAGQLTFMQRALYVAGGLLLAAAGAKPRPNPILNVVALAAGGYLAWRGSEGSCPIKATLAGNPQMASLKGPGAR